ncbi:hypothetical protein [Phaeobacter sp. C3_T13_0]|uniref:hypothetical protein n=1 Tax=Phaeobacter cretensis TaxID=3342641 RepID=UPI0039BD7C16
MQKTMITTATVAALVLSTGTSMAGPLGGNGNRAFTQDVRSSVSQTLSQFDQSTLAHQTTTVTGSNPSTELPNVVFIPVDGDGKQSWVIGKTPSNVDPIWFYGCPVQAFC